MHFQLNDIFNLYDGFIRMSPHPSQPYSISYRQLNDVKLKCMEFSLSWIIFDSLPTLLSILGIQNLRQCLPSRSAESTREKALCARPSQCQVAARMLRGEGCPLGSLRKWHAGEALDINYLWLKLEAEILSGIIGWLFSSASFNISVFVKVSKMGINTILIVRNKRNKNNTHTLEINCQYQKYPPK